jgi:hypothetical protein
MPISHADPMKGYATFFSDEASIGSLWCDLVQWPFPFYSENRGWHINTFF